MTTQSEKVQTTPLTPVDEWLQSLSSDQMAVLERFQDSHDLPNDVLSILESGPLSPMQVSNGEGQGASRMPPAIKQALMQSRWA